MTTSSPPRGVSSRPRSSPRESSGTTSTRSSGTPAYLNRSADVFSQPADQRPEIHVPDPRDVPPVGDPVVQRDHRESRRTAVQKRADHFVRPGGILHEEDERVPVTHLETLEAAERRLEVRQPVTD